MTTMAQSIPDRDQLLRRAIQADAAVSGASTAALLLAAGPIAAATGIPAGTLQAIGVAFIPFVALCLYVGARPALDRRLATVIMGLNFAWVALSVAALIFGWLPLTSAGFWAVVGQAVAVDLLAVAQYLGLRRRG